MTAELHKGCRDFVGSVSQISKDELISPLVSEFLRGVNSGKIEIHQSELVHDLRLQTNSLDGRVIVVIPTSFSPNWGGDTQKKAVASLVFDAVGVLREVSGPSMICFDEMKRVLLSSLERV